MIDMLLNILSNYQSRIINLGEFVNECGCLSYVLIFIYKGREIYNYRLGRDNDMNVIIKFLMSKYWCKEKIKMKYILEGRKHVL